LSAVKELKIHSLGQEFASEMIENVDRPPTRQRLGITIEPDSQLILACAPNEIQIPYTRGGRLQKIDSENCF